MAVTFAHLPLHYIYAYPDEAAARNAAAHIKRDKPHEVARVFPRQVRAGGESVMVWVVVVKGKPVAP